jgi:hypothetical protein
VHNAFDDVFFVLGVLCVVIVRITGHVQLQK